MVEHGFVRLINQMVPGVTDGAPVGGVSLMLAKPTLFSAHDRVTASCMSTGSARLVMRLLLNGMFWVIVVWPSLQITFDRPSRKLSSSLS